MSYFIVRECACGGGDSKEVTEVDFETELAKDLGGELDVKDGNEVITYHIHSCSMCRAEQDAEEA